MVYVAVVNGIAYVLDHKDSLAVFVDRLKELGEKVEIAQSCGIHHDAGSAFMDFQHTENMKMANRLQDEVMNAYYANMPNPFPTEGSMQ